MFEATLTLTVIAALAGGVAYASWPKNKGLAAVFAVIGVLAAAGAVLTAFLGAVVLVLKIIPVLVLAGVIWVAWKIFSGGSGTRTDHADVRPTR